jgi:hypothetical protein
LIFLGGYILKNAWDVEYTDAFEAWWGGLDNVALLEIAFSEIKVRVIVFLRLPYKGGGKYLG